MKWSCHFIFCHICYGKSEVKFFNMVIKVIGLLGIEYLFQKHGFLSNALSFFQVVKIDLPNIEENREFLEQG